MRICLAQIQPVKGNIERNIEQHCHCIDLAIAAGAHLIVFPELSLTGYEPQLAKDTATTCHHERFNVFQQKSDAGNIVIAAGAPTTGTGGTCISLLIFQPHANRQLYSKQFLHADEEPFFVSGCNSPLLQVNNTRVAFAICYELTIPEHATAACQSGAQVYIASVAKSTAGVQKAVQRLADVAVEYNIPVCMCNCVGYCDNFTSAGTSAAWNSQGVLLAQLDDATQGMLLVDTITQETIPITLAAYTG